MAVGRCCLGCFEPQRLTSNRNRGIKTRRCLSPDYAKHVVEWGKARSGDLRLALQLIYTALFTAARLWKPLGSAPRCQLENVTVDHGVSLLRWRSGGVEHPHDTPPYPLMPSPTFAHSSQGCTYRTRCHEAAHSSTSRDR